MATNGKTSGLLKSTPPKVLGSMPMDQAIAAPIAVAQTQAGRGTTDRPSPMDWPTPSSAPSHAPARIMDGNTTKTGAPTSANNPPVAAGIANPMASPAVTENIHRRQNPLFTSPPANVRVFQCALLRRLAEGARPPSPQQRKSPAHDGLTVVPHSWGGIVFARVSFFKVIGNRPWLT